MANCDEKLRNVQEHDTLNNKQGQDKKTLYRTANRLKKAKRKIYNQHE